MAIELTPMPPRRRSRRSIKRSTSHEDGIETLRTIVAHRDHVRKNLLTIQQDLERRALEHDLSKLSPEEFPGFCRINKAAREHPYGSEEYKAGLRQEGPTVLHHYALNSHHPEHHGVTPLPRGFCGTDRPVAARNMGFLDLIEMVCDWRAAYIVYGSQGTWADNMRKQRERYLEEDGSPENSGGWLNRSQRDSHD